jgi:hypothetical protein
MIQRERNYPKQLNIQLKPETLQYYRDQADAANSTPGTLARRILEREATRNLQQTDGHDEAA